MGNYYVEGEIKEIKFTDKKVLFSLEPSEEFKRKEGDRKFVLVLLPDNDKLLVECLPIGSFEKVFFVCQSDEIKMQIATIKINRCKVRVYLEKYHIDKIRDYNVDECKPAWVVLS